MRDPRSTNCWGVMPPNVDPIASLTFNRREDFPNLPRQFFQVVFDHRPNNLAIDAKILVDENVAHADDLFPRNLRVSVAQCR